jgi:beta-N-acetylhexosaminidase
MAPPLPENIAEHEALVDTPLRSLRSEADYPPEAPRYDAICPPDEAWVEASLRAMTLEQKVGQLFISTATKAGDGEDQIARFHIGGFIFMGNGQLASDIVAATNRLQAASPFPLWFAIDSESGLGSRCRDAAIFPMLMAFGAADQEQLAEECGRITARESRALGLHLTFGPVVDLATEPRNPIIATRSYGADPEQVTRLARAHVRGARSEGILPTLKHYPGHGPTAADSHLSLPQVDLALPELERTHLRPFIDLSASRDADLIMTAHLWYPQQHPGEPYPATFSHYFNVQLLREKYGFEGLLVSDAYDMAGCTIPVPEARERGVVGIEAGLDLILGDHNSLLPETWQGIVDAVRSGRLTESRIDESVRRILRAKSSVHLPENRLTGPDAWRAVLNHPEHRAVIRTIAEQSPTEALAAPEFLPLQPTDRVLLITLGASQRIFYRYPASPLIEALSAELPGLEHVHLSRPVKPAEVAALQTAAAQAQKIVVAGYDWSSMSSATQLELLAELSTAGSTPMIYVCLGSPYHATQLPSVAGIYCSYASLPESQEAMAEVLLGRRAANGKLPVELQLEPAGS